MSGRRGWTRAQEASCPFVTPPGFSDTVPGGYFHLPSTNNQGYALLRSILKSRGDNDIADAVAYRETDRLPAESGCQPAADDVRGCGRHRVRRRHSVQRTASSSRCTAWCRPSHGWSATAR